ncbi:MAG: DUF3820 family protein [Bacteroidetes bacterium]|nr:DUF3820 family protein [Bacteroidota bacterium]MBK7587720.1 DUF3820 family protein [Bacteroidota bacterium]
METPNQWNSAILLEIVNTPMPFGKYKGTLLCNLPDSYLEWFLRKEGFPKGKLGQLMATVYEIKLNGLEYLLEPLKRM